MVQETSWDRLGSMKFTLLEEGRSREVREPLSQLRAPGGREPSSRARKEDVFARMGGKLRGRREGVFAPGGGRLFAPGGREIARARSRPGGDRALQSDVDRPNTWMQSSEEVGIYAKPQPLFAKFTKLQTSIAKPLEGYFLVFFFFANMSMQSLFAKPLEML
jgi:hypothetical protein